MRNARATRRLIEGEARDDGAEYSLYAWSLEWMARWLLSFGPDAEAIAPARLRKLVQQEARAVFRRNMGMIEEACAIVCRWSAFDGE